MSTKAHFIYGDEVEGYEETIEPHSIFGKFTGYNVHMIWNKDHVHGIKIDGEYIILSVTPFEKMPGKFKIWGDAIIGFDYDIDGLESILKGGHHITEKIIKGNYNTEL